MALFLSLQRDATSPVLTKLRYRIWHRVHEKGIFIDTTLFHKHQQFLAKLHWSCKMIEKENTNVEPKELNLSGTKTIENLAKGIQPSPI